MNIPPTIFFDHVKKTYKADIGKKPKVALADLSLAIQPGDIIGIIGPNGAGKSTALKILMGFVRQDSGTVELEGVDPRNPASHQQLGYLPENPCLYSHLSIRDHLRFPAKIASFSSIQTNGRIEELLHQVDLLDVADIPIRLFSKGMTQRAALAYSLFLKPKILVLDEPMSGLDPIGRKLVVDIINENRQQGTTILFCSHILSDVERICDRIHIMNHGRIIASIKPATLQGDSTYPKLEDMSPLESYFFQTIQNDIV